MHQLGVVHHRIDGAAPKEVLLSPDGRIALTIGLISYGSGSVFHAGELPDTRGGYVVATREAAQHQLSWTWVEDAFVQEGAPIIVGEGGWSLVLDDLPASFARPRAGGHLAGDSPRETYSVLGGRRFELSDELETTRAAWSYPCQLLLVPAVALDVVTFPLQAIYFFSVLESLDSGW